MLFFFICQVFQAKKYFCGEIQIITVTAIIMEHVEYYIVDSSFTGFATHFFHHMHCYWKILGRKAKANA